MKKPSDLNEHPLPKLYYPLNSSFPVESDLVETKLISSWFIGFAPDKEESAVYNSNLFGLVLEYNHEPPKLNLGLNGIIKSSFMPSRGSLIVNIFNPIISL
jgi:hypothetical protein